MCKAAICKRARYAAPYQHYETERLAKLFSFKIGVHGLLLVYFVQLWSETLFNRTEA